MSQRRRRKFSTPCLQLLTAVALASFARGTQAFLVGPHVIGSGGRQQCPIGNPAGAIRTLPKLAKPSGTTMAAKNDDSATASMGGSEHSGGGGSSSNSTTCTCRNCKQQFRREDNVANACSFHPGLFSGRLNRINDVDTSGLEYFWSCCGQTDRSHPGCATSSHASYDDPAEGGEGAWRSPLTGTLR